MWLKQPLVDLEAINQRLDIVDAFVGDPTLREALRDIHLRGQLQYSKQERSTPKSPLRTWSLTSEDRAFHLGKWTINLLSVVSAYQCV